MKTNISKHLFFMIIASIVLAGHAPRFFDVALDRTAEDKAQLGLDAAQPAP